MDSLTLYIIFEMENMKCALMKFTEKISLIKKSGFVTTLIKCSSFDLYLEMYLLTSDLNFNLKNTNYLCIQFTDWLYFTPKIEFLIKCSLSQVQTRHFKDFEL